MPRPARRSVDIDKVRLGCETSHTAPPPASSTADNCDSRLRSPPLATLLRQVRFASPYLLLSPRQRYPEGPETLGVSGAAPELFLQSPYTDRIASVHSVCTLRISNAFESLKISEVGRELEVFWPFVTHALRMLRWSGNASHLMS